MIKLDILKNKGAYAFMYEAQRKKGKNVPEAIRLAQIAQERINTRASEKPDSKHRTAWPFVPCSIYYNPLCHNGQRWIENVSEGLRFVGKAHDIVRLNHTGWYTDSCQDSLAIGVVYQLPARDGTPYYVPAVLDPFNDDCASIDFSQGESDKESAAIRADRMAEIYAENEREYEAKDRAEQETEELREEIKTIRQDIIKACQEAKTLRDSEICDKAKTLFAMAKNQAEKLLRLKREKEERIEDLQDNFWLSVESF